MVMYLMCVNSVFGRGQEKNGFVRWLQRVAGEMTASWPLYKIAPEHQELSETVD